MSDSNREMWGHLSPKEKEDRRKDEEIETLRRQQLDLIRILDPEAECYTHAEAIEELKTARRCIEQLQQIAVIFNRDPERSLADLDDATGELMDLLTEALPYVECELDSGAYKSRDIENRIRRAIGAIQAKGGDRG